MNHNWMIAGILICFTLVTNVTSQGEFSLEEVMAYGFPYELTVSKAENLAAWVENREGIRNIFVSDGSGSVRQVTSFTREEGQELGELVISPDNRYICFTRGGEPNDKGNVPNPLSLPEPPERQIWRVSLENGTADILSEGHSPVVSNKGDQLVFIKNGEVWMADMHTGDPTERMQSGDPMDGMHSTGDPREGIYSTGDPMERMQSGDPMDGMYSTGDSREGIYSTGDPREGMQSVGGNTKFLFSAGGEMGSLAWSPDDRKIAFVTDRSDHAFIGIFDLEENRISYPDPGVDNDRSPAWSPDGRYIVFLRIPQNFSLPFTPRRSALPWSIRIIDLQQTGSGRVTGSGRETGNGRETRSGREVWKASEGTGSVFSELPGPCQIFWTAGGNLVFPWERNGWLHLYSIRTDGSGLRLLTPGESEVQHVTLSGDGKQLAYASNEGDIDRLHLWKIDLPDGKPVQLTGREGIEWSPRFSSPGNQLFLLASGPVTPAFPAIIREGKIIPLHKGKPQADYPSEQMVVPEPVVYSATDGMQIRGQLFFPPGMKKNTQYPAVIYLHGGSRRQMLLGFHPMDYYHHAYAFNQYLASRGYIVLSINFRSGTGYGMEFREALNYGPRGASEFQDVLGAGLYLRSRPEVDGGRIGLWGGSYGGYLTALGLARDSDIFAAGVDLHGVHDWNEDMPSFHPGYDPLKYPDAAALARSSSPIACIEGWRSPVLLIHGDDDREVFFNQTVLLVEELRKHDVPFEHLVFPDEVHGFLLHSSWLRAFRASFDFFERHLKEKPR